MKKFLTKSIYFCLFVILLMGLTSIINYLSYSKDLKSIKKHNILIVGDSHPQYSINPKLLHDAINISQVAEPYVLTYWKLKKIFKTIKPDTVMIGFAPHNISAFNDLKFSNKKWAAEMFKRSYPIGNFDALKDKIEIDYESFYKVFAKQMCLIPRLNHVDYIGKYMKSNLSDVTNFDQAIQRHYYFDEEELGVSDIAISYLDSIIQICNLHQMEGILVSSPLTNSYYQKIPKRILNRYVKLMEAHALNGVTVIDMHHVTYPDSLFLNSDHLNSKGSARFTKELMQKISSFSQE